ncbi:MAG: hypothetical protein LIP03_14725, partial [Bacteroidales bacterium]|nr:hypothetical protein [Bacteroidales bacterium]
QRSEATLGGVAKGCKQKNYSPRRGGTDSASMYRLSEANSKGGWRLERTQPISLRSIDWG